MEVSTKQLRMGSGRIISQVHNGQTVTITYRGKPMAKIVPLAPRHENNSLDTQGELFGLWKDRDDMKDVEGYIRNARKGRSFDN